jgi:alcohol dehydrogenase class IV
VKRLVGDLRIPSLRELGIKREKLEEVAPQMAKDAIASGSPGNNRRQASEKDIVELYFQAY